jgi:hypothetical protein
MKENKVTIQINKSIEEVFEFTINPNNTPLWIEHLEKEETNEYPPKIGTIYRNHGESKVWDEYFVSAFEENKVFELTSKDGIYHVRYTYIQINENITEMEYFEWVDQGELSNPFTVEVLQKLKEVMERDR